MSKEPAKKKPVNPLAQMPDIPLPAPLEAAGIERGMTPRRMTAYQKKLLAFFGPHVLVPLMQTLRKKITLGDKDSMELAAKIYKLIDGKGIQINTNVNSNNTADNRTAVFSGARPLSFDQVVRQLEAGRARPIQAPVPTPPAIDLSSESAEA